MRCNCCNKKTATYYIRSRDEYLCEECIEQMEKTNDED